MASGTVFLVGAGPGDPDLLTLKGAKLLARAEVVIYDHLAAPALLNQVPAGAEKIYAGKEGGSHTLKQEEINKLLLEKAQAGKRVVRLKGGDPYLFGRGSEEAEYLKKNGITVEVVPGIPSAIGAAAYAGIPLTDRYDALAASGATLVFFMGIRNLPVIAAELMKNGLAPETLVSIVEQATLPIQRVLSGTLSDIAEKATQAGIKPPGLIIVGKVNELHPFLNWYEEKPLFGKRFIVTRSRDQASFLTAALSDKGASVLELPTIQCLPLEKFDLLDSAISRLKEFDWLLFTSVNGVAHFFERLFSLGHDSRALAAVKMGAIGSATEAKLKEFGLRSDLKPERYTSHSLFKALSQAGQIKSKRFLLARADIADVRLAEELTQAGAAQVSDVAVYRTLSAPFDVELARTEIESGHIDGITFTSSSTVKYFTETLGKEFVAAHIEAIHAYSIGPETSGALRALSLSPKAEAVQCDIPGLVQTIVNSFQPSVQEKS